MEMLTSLYYIASKYLANWYAFVHVYVIGQELCFSLDSIHDHTWDRLVWSSLDVLMFFFIYGKLGISLEKYVSKTGI